MNWKTNYAVIAGRWPHVSGRRFRVWLPSINVALAVWLLLCGGRLDAEGPYDLGANVQVSLAQAAVQHYETQIGADPERADHLIACAYVLRADKSSDNVFYVSFDRGATWSHTLTVSVAVDPSCQIGLKGEAFAASVHDVARPDGNSDSFLVVHRSPDGGRTWTASSIAIDTRSVDRTYLTVDESRGLRRGRIYVHGYLQDNKDAAGKALPSAFVLYTSSDDGVAFDHALTRPGTQPGIPWFFPANGVVADDGTFVALVAELDKKKSNMSYRTDAASAPSAANGILEVLRSRDGGLTVDASTIGDLYHDWRVPQLSVSSLAIDRSAGPFKGRLYAGWPDARGGQTQIRFASSNDLGRTWTAPRVISDDTGPLPGGDRPNDFMPMVAVDKDGVVAVAWYDRRDNPDNVGYFERLSASLDGGATWLPSIRVSSRANVPEAGNMKLNGGDTGGLAADANGVFHPVWIDNRTGVHQMWTATVAVRGVVRKPLDLQNDGVGMSWMVSERKR